MVFSNNLLMGAAAAASGGEAAYVPAGAIVLNGSDEYLARTPSSGSASTKFTLSIWFKRGTFSEQYLFMQGSDASNLDVLEFTADATIQYREYTGSVTADLITSQVFRDPTAWYHLVLSYDTTLEAAGERVKLYINGDRVTAFGTQSNPSSDSTSMIGGTSQMTIGRKTPGTTWYYPGYLSEYIFLDGYAALPTDFGTTNSNNLWVPKDPTDSVTANKGTNGFWLDFADSSDLGNDVSGNNNDFTPYNMGTTNSVLDRCADDAATNVGNYWTLNPLAATDTLTNGNLSFTGAANFSTYVTAPALPMTGKWYYEVKATGGDAPIGTSASYDAYLGLVRTDIAIPTGSHTSNPGLWVIANWNPTPSGQKNNNSTATYTPTTGFGDGSIIMVAVDLDNNAIWFGNDGTWAGSATASEIAAGTTTNAAFTSSNNSFGSHQMMPYQANYSDLATYNFGATAFAHTPPTGFKALSTANLSEPTVKNGANNFLPMIYEGNGAGQRVGNFIPFTDSHTVDNSCVFDGSSDYMNKTFSTSGTNRKKFTFSCWFKLGALGATGTLLSCDDTSSDNEFMFWVESGGNIRIANYVGGSNKLNLITNRLFLDASTWYNLVLEADSTPSTPSISSIKLYINGSQIPSSGFSTQTYPTQNFDFALGNAFDHEVGRYALSDNNLWNGYISEMVFIDGTCYDASSFGQTDTSTNRWIPKDVSGLTFGTNGFYLEFETSSNLGDDTSGNTNDFTVNNIVAANQTNDTPTKNFSTLNPNTMANTSGTLTEGNLKYTASSNGNTNYGTIIIPTSGKWYFEATVNSQDTNLASIGIKSVSSAATDTDDFSGVGGYGMMQANNSGLNGHRFENSTTTLPGGGAAQSVTWSTSDRVNIAYDADNRKLYFGKNGTYYNFESGATITAASIANNTATPQFGTIINQEYLPAVSGNSSSGGTAYTFNFGGGGFTDTAPTGFVALNQDNLSENTAGITGFSWIKNRDATDNHILQDRVRGATNYIISNNADVEATNANSVQKFLQQGVQIGNMDAVNTSAESYVLWQWAANGTGTLNELGSIDSYVSANTDAGFSIVKYTGTGSAATVGHGLSSAPYFIVNKTLGSGSTDANWQVYHSEVGATKAMFFNTNGSPATSSTYWNNTAPTATVFSIGTDRDSAVEYINYCWVEVEGYSKFGSFTGNNSSDGPYINMGFAPSYFMFKRTDGNGDWYTFDSSRSPYNPATNLLAYNQTKTESTMASDSSNGKIDFLSNGIKFRSGNGSDFNGSGATFIYAAWAENPFGGSGVGQARAR